MQTRCAVFLAFALAAFVLPHFGRSHTISHVVVLMMENRSFDHMLGYLKANNSNIDGLTGTESNKVNISDPNSKTIVVNPNALYVDPDPGHSVQATQEQVFGNGPVTQDPAPMNGFVQQGMHEFGKGELVMAMFNPKTTPVINTLAMQFAVFDKWYSAVPGPTEVNRMFANAATSYGDCTNEHLEHIIPGYPSKTIFESLDESGKDWAVYFNDISAVLYFRYVRENGKEFQFHFFKEFEAACKNNTLPAFSWIEPRYYEDFGYAAADQHPSHDVSEGERFMKLVYETLRNSPSWNNTLLIITYDEHGGFYDHAPTPIKNVPNPDGRNCHAPDPVFDFNRLGVRIPTIAISPWIDKQTVVHDPSGPTPDSKFDHTSTLATVKKLFNLPNFLNKRDAWAGTFESVFSTRTTPRTDCPTTLPNPPKLRKLPMKGDRPLSELQKSWLQLAAAIAGQNGVADPMPQNEGEARAYVLNAMSKFTGKPIPEEELLGPEQFEVIPE